MGWFDEQIRQRKQQDNEVFSDAFLGIADAVMGTHTAQKSSRLIARTAMDEILKFYNVKSQELPEDITDPDGQLEYLWGIMRRPVNLEEGWYKDAVGAMLATRKDDGSFTALIPGQFTGYTFLDGSGNRVKVNAANADLFEAQALAFYKPFPLRSMGLRDFIQYMLGCLSISDFVLTALAGFALSLIGLLTPFFNKLIFSDVVNSKSLHLLLSVTVFLVCVNISALLLGAVRELLLSRIQTKLGLSVEAAAMMRVLSLPTGFFKNYSSGELSLRVQYVHSADFCICPGAGVAGGVHYFIFCGRVSAVCQNHTKKRAVTYGAGDERKGHELCFNIRCAENQAGGGGKACLRPLGKFVCTRGQGDL